MARHSYGHGRRTDLVRIDAEEGSDVVGSADACHGTATGQWHRKFCRGGVAS